jgi:predicted Rossmann fold nucleotide-binding protein DprA/Smf involved in DNA uptake
MVARAVHKKQSFKRAETELASTAAGWSTGPSSNTRPRCCRSTILELLGVDESRHIDDIVERSGLHSSEVLATLFDLEMKGLIRQLPGKQIQQGFALASQSAENKSIM